MKSVDNSSLAERSSRLLKKPASSDLGKSIDESFVPELSPKESRSIETNKKDIIQNLPLEHPLLLAFKEEKLSPNLIKSARLSNSGRGVVLCLSADWEKFDFAEKLSLARDFQDRIKDFGYDTLKLEDFSGHLLGRTSMISSDMVVFDSNLG